MRKYGLLISMCVVCMSFALTAWSADGARENDWMLHGGRYKAYVKQSGGRLIMGNGLVERQFKDGTTVGMNNLMTGEGMLRSVRAEAELEIDGVRIPVGGLLGQPAHNYLLPEWIAEMTSDPMAFSFAGYETSPIKKRFDWKPRSQWISLPTEWPAKGIELVMKYRAGDELLRRLEARFASDDNRTAIASSDFSGVLPEGWRVVTSDGNTANAFSNEGKTGEILIPANTCAYVEKDIPQETEVVVARITPGTDRSSSWGPGMAWVFDGRVVKLYLRTADSRFGMTVDGSERMLQTCRVDAPVYIRMQRTGGVLTCGFSYDGKAWTVLGETDIEPTLQSRCVRAGKMDLSGGNTEHADKGAPGRCRVDLLKVMGGLPQNKGERMFDYLKDLEVNIHYEIYDGIPLISKWFTLGNGSSRSVRLDTYKSEILAVMEPENTVVFNRSFTTPNITVESDLVHANQQDGADRFDNLMIQHHVHWNRDPLYTTQVDWPMNIPCLLESYPEYGPAEDISSGAVFASHRVWELFHDTWDRERKTLQVRRMYRVAAPWIHENPIFMHVRNADDASVKKAIDQCAEVGFEMVIMTFWSGVDLEDDSPANLERMKKLADYAHSKGIALGGYSLLASRSVGKDDDVVMPEGKTPQFGAAPCLGSEWGLRYMDKLRRYFETTGQDILEHDGSYPGDECASTSHPGHKGLADSQWKQYQTISGFYKDCKSKGIFLNIPDWYFMNGQNKTGMGYREANWSLPRKLQEIIERQNIYDGTWIKAPSMGWMMVPLVEYQGGGAAATIEPLKEHLPHYEMRLANNFGAGVIACYRGPQLFDSPETKAVVKKWVDFYKAHRPILDSDIIHLRRPDGNDWDGFIHVNPDLKEKGLMMLYNPLSHNIRKKIRVPLYYTGLKDKVTVRHADGITEKLRLDSDCSLLMDIEIPAGYCSWYVFE